MKVAFEVLHQQAEPMFPGSFFIEKFTNQTFLAKKKTFSNHSHYKAVLFQSQKMNKTVETPIEKINSNICG